MGVEENSYYIKYHVGEENEATLSYYSEVWKDGFAFEDYCISDCHIYYENAIWHGKSPNSFYCGTRILARQFQRWVNEIKRTNEKLIQFGKAAGIETVKELKEGECVFCTILPYDPEYDKVQYCFFEITSVEDDFITAKEILIDSNYSYYSKDVKRISFEEEYWLSEALKNNHVKFVDKSTFMRAAEIIRLLTKKLMEEIKEKVEIIET